MATRAWCATDNGPMDPRNVIIRSAGTKPPVANCPVCSKRIIPELSPDGKAWIRPWCEHDRLHRK